MIGIIISIEIMVFIEVFTLKNGGSNDDAPTNDPTIYEGDALFMLDGMDDVPTAVRQLQASDQESDADGKF